MRSESLTVAAGLRRAARILEPVSDTPGLDSQTLLARITGRPRAWLLAHPEQALAPDVETRLAGALECLQDGTPLPYVLGEWEFYGRAFAVSPAVLIPRPETELLVGQAVAWLRAHPGRRSAADVGTGSGCIAVSLAVEIPDVRVAASDVSEAALAVARENAARHDVAGRIIFSCADLLSAAPRGLDLICANLPYIPTAALSILPVHGREPDLALDGGPDGLALIRRLLAQAGGTLAAGGLLLAEIEERQGEAARDSAREAFPRAHIEILKDLAGKDRLLKIEN